MSTAISGIVAYPVTPFTPDNDIHVDALHRLIDRMVEAGVHAIAPLGSTGESVYLNLAEWTTVAAEAIARVAGRVPTVVGVSDFTTDGAIERTRIAERLGASAVMVLPTSYWRLTPTEVRGHMTAIAGATSLPVMVYNNPATTGVDMSAEFLFDLVETVENITMVKESSGDITRMHRLRELSGGTLAFFNGKNPMAEQAFAAGATGWCTAAPCLAPEAVVAFYNATITGDTTAARTQFQALKPLLDFIVSRALPATIKSGVTNLGIDVGVPRLPLLPLEPPLSEQLDQLIAAQQGQPAL